MLEALWRALGRLFGRSPTGTSTTYAGPVSPVRFRRLLKRYYDGLELYAGLEQGPKSLRNLARRSVEFHAMHLFPGANLEEALPLEAESDTLKERIDDVWKWSNWAQKKQVYARHLALYGDAFIKVVGSAEKRRVWFELLDPRFITSFKEDERGYITELRIDKPQDADDIINTQHTLTEVWSKEAGTRRMWLHEEGEGTKIEDLPPPRETDSLISLGVDFVPIVHAKFHDDGDETSGGRGVGVFAPYLDQLDELNRMATRSSDLLFVYNRNLWALMQSGFDKDGRPIPAPRLSGSLARARDTVTGDNWSRQETETDDGALENDGIVRLAGGQSLESLIPPVDHQAGRDLARDAMQELAEEMPELLYNQLKDKGDISGRALAIIMMPAVKRGEEARGNAEAALIQADQMALTQAQNLALKGFAIGDIGTFRDQNGEDTGDFEHAFAERAVLPESEVEKQETLTLKIANYRALVDGGLMSPEDAAEEVGIAITEGLRAQTPTAEPNGDALSNTRALVAQLSGASDNGRVAIDGPNPTA